MIARTLILYLYYVLRLNQRTCEIKSYARQVTVHELISHHFETLQRIQLSYVFHCTNALK